MFIFFIFLSYHFLPPSFFQWNEEREGLIHKQNLYKPVLNI